MSEARPANGLARPAPAAPVEGLAAQQAWMVQQAQDLGYASLDELVRRDSAALARLAVQWRVNHRPPPPRGFSGFGGPGKSGGASSPATLALVAQSLNLSVQDCLRANRPAEALRVLREQQSDRLMRAILQRLVLLMRECEQQGGVQVQGSGAEEIEALEAAALAHALVSECLQVVLGRMLRAPAAQVCREHRLALDRLREVWAQTRRFEATSVQLGVDAKTSLADFADQVLLDGSLRASMRAQPWRMGTLWHAFKQGVLAALGLREGEMLLGTMADSVDEILRRDTGAGVCLVLTVGAAQARPS